MSDQTFQSYQQISRGLMKLGWLWKALILSRVFFNWLALSIALLLTFIAVKSIVLNLFNVGNVSNVGIFFSFFWALFSVASGLFLIIKSGFNLVSKDKIAARVDSKFPASEDRIVSAVQLFPELQRNRYGYSRIFLSKVIDEANSQFNRFSFSSILANDLKALKKAAALLVLCALFLLTSYSTFPSQFQSFFQSFAFYSEHPSQNFGLEIVQVEPGNYEAEAGEDVKIVAKIKGELPSKVGAGARHAVPTLFYKNLGNVGNVGNVGNFSDGEWTSEDMNLSAQPDQLAQADQTKDYQITLKNVSESLKYYVSVDRLRSKEYQISTIRHPILSKFQLKLNYPKYAQMPPKTLEPNLGEIQTLTGSYVEFRGKANKPLKSAQLIFDDGSNVGNVGNVGNSFKVDLEVTNQTDISGGFTVKKSGKYYISLLDSESHQNRDPIEYPINAIKDQPPKVEIVSPGQDIVLDESMRLPLEVEATDDYGVKSIKLNYKIEGQKPEEKSLTLKLAKTPSATMSAQYIWDLNQLKLYPEDVVVYYAEAYDADDVSGPNAGRSRSYVARFPSLVELMEEVENEQGTAQGNMEKTLEDQRDVKAITDELADRLRKNQELTWNEKKQLERAIQTQQEIEKQAQRLAEQLEQTTNKIEERSLLSREAIEKHQQLQKLIEEVATEEMKEAMKKLSEALKELNPSEQEKKLLAASFKEEELIQRLEQMIELFKKLRLQQQLEAAANEAKELKERQGEITEQTKQASEQIQNPKSKIQNPNLDDLGKREERNAEALSKLQQDLQSLSEEMKKEGENYSRVAEEISQLEQESKKRQIESNLRMASRRLRQNQPQSALEPANEALAGLKELHQGLDNAMEFMRGANADKALKAMQKAVRGGLHMSETHERIMEQTSQLLSNLKSQPTPGEKRRMDALAAEELRTAEEAEMVARQLWELGSNENAMMVDPRLIWRLRAASDALTRAARALEDKNANLAVPMQRGALSDINRTVAELLQAMDQMNQQMGAAGLENMLEQLQQLAQNQSQLNELSKQLSEQMRQQGRSRQLEDMLNQMAYEQSLIREATDRLSEKMDRLAQALGNLKDLAKDMQDVEGELRKGKLDENVLKKQREILTRLLESEKSLQKRQTSEKRKAQTAKQQYLGNPPSQLDPELIKLRKELSQFDLTQSEKLPEEYKELIQLYYKALSEKVRRQ